MATNSNKLIRCGDKFIFNKKKKIPIRDCACGCEYLLPIGIPFLEACIASCNKDSNTDTENFLCNTYDPVTIYNRTGQALCGYNPLESAEAQIFFSEQERTEKQDESNSQLRKIILGILGIIIVGLLLATLLKKE